MLSEHIYKRGGYYWYRRRVGSRGSAGFTVAFSLGVRDPIEAKRVGRRIDVEVDKMLLVRMKAPSQAPVKDALKLHVDMQEHDRAARLRTDLDRVAEIDPRQRESVLRSRYVQSRIYAALNTLAAKHGRDCATPPRSTPNSSSKAIPSSSAIRFATGLAMATPKRSTRPAAPSPARRRDLHRRPAAPHQRAATPEMRDWFLMSAWRKSAPPSRPSPPSGTPRRWPTLTTPIRPRRLSCPSSASSPASTGRRHRSHWPTPSSAAISTS